jgi:hypothetical protein
MGQASRIVSHCLVAILLFALVPACALAQGAPDSRFPIPDSPLEISLLTIGPGPIFWERFGHNAIVVGASDPGTPIAEKNRNLEL